GLTIGDAVVTSCRIRLRPILMTSLATVFGLIPMALKLGTGSEAYAPLARAIIGGLVVSVALTIFVVPAAYLLVYRRGKARMRTFLIVSILAASPVSMVPAPTPAPATAPPLSEAQPRAPQSPPQIRARPHPAL